MASPKSFADVEGDFRGSLLSSYSTNSWALNSFGTNYAVTATAGAPSFFRGTLDFAGKPFFAVLEGSLSSKLVDLRASSLGYRISKEKSVQLAANGVATFTFKDETFNASATTNLLDGFPTDVSISTLLCKGANAGASLSYDPSRSGLKNYTLTLTANRVKELRDAAVLLKLDATEGYGLGLTFPLKNNLSVTGLFSRRELKVGGRLSTPCGRSLTAFVDAASRSLAISTEMGGEAWKVALSATFAAQNPTKPAFGVSFTA